MKKILLVFLLLIFAGTAVPKGFAHNPFTTKPANQHTATPLFVKNTFFIKMVQLQHRIREKMSGLMREAKSGHTLTPLLLLCVFAYAYGVVHSAGPGHGKAVALSYIMSCRPSLRTGLAFGNILAMTHGLSGIGLVLAVKYILEASITTSLETMTYVTQVLSFSLITLMGVAIVVRRLIKWIRHSDGVERKSTHARGHYAAAFAVGLVPCPGVVMVMLFAISLGLTGLGIFLGFCIAAGMATTITGVTLVAVSGKTAALTLSAKNNRLYIGVETAIEMMAGIAVALIGATFLLANL